MPPELLRQAPRSAIAIYAHPDDSDVSCGGTLADWSRLGSEVHVVICTTGDKGSSDAHADVAKLVAQRHSELIEAAAVLGIADVHHLSYPDGELENDLELRRQLVELIRSCRPEALVCPDPLAVFFGEHYYNHRDHRVVGFAALDSVSPAASSPLYFPDAGEPCSPSVAYLSGSLEPSIYVDVGETIDIKAKAILCHKSQLRESDDGFTEVVRDRAEQAGRNVGVRYAEAFRRLRLGS